MSGFNDEGRVLLLASHAQPRNSGNSLGSGNPGREFASQRRERRFSRFPLGIPVPSLIPDLDSIPVSRRQPVGVAMVVLAGILFTVSNVVQNMYLKHVEFCPVLFFRAILQILITWFGIWHNDDDVFPNHHRVLIATQGLIGGVLLMAIFTAVTTVPLGKLILYVIEL